MINIDNEPIESDVLIMGGGIAGLMAAIRAVDQGASVTIAEKANTKRSGSGATGNDHFCCYIPEVHGSDIKPIIWEFANSLLGRYQDLSLITLFLEQSFSRVKDWDGWGIPMKPTGEWEFTGHAFPGRPRIWLKYEGADQKKVLTMQAKKRGVRIENHLPITDVIVEDGEIKGAIGINTEKEEPVIKLFHAKSLILASGSATRLYPPAATPGWIFNIAHCPSNTGGGRAIAYRAGAKLINMEIPYTHAGPRYFSRAGKATWIGVFRDPHGKPVGPFVEKPTREIGDVTSDIWNSVFTDFQKAGKGPVYMDCTGTSEEDIEYMIWGLKNEGQTAMLDYMDEQGINVRIHAIEFMQYEPILLGRGIEINENAETNVRGLYAAGDELGNFRGAVAGASTFGWIAGKSAAERAKKITGFKKIKDSRLVKERVKLYSEIMERESGPSWREANLALQQIMKDYAGPEVRSASLLRAGLKYLRDLKGKVTTTLTANNSHTMLRSLEVLDLIDCGEMVLLTALERKETRGLHKRSDFPFTNPLLQDKFITIRQENGKPQIEWRDRN